MIRGRLGTAGWVLAAVVGVGLVAGTPGASASAVRMADPGPATTAGPAITTGLGPNPSGASLLLLSQTSWVSDASPGDVFELRVVPHAPASAGDPEVNVEVYDVLDNRSEFARSLTTAFAGYVIAHPIRAPLSSFARDSSGAIDIKISVGREVGQLHLYEAGVYPVTVDLRPPGGGAPLARFVTHLIYNPGPPGSKLNVVWVVPIHAPPADPTTGRITAAQTAQLTALIDAVATHPSVAVTVQPTPDTIAALETADPALVNRLGESISASEVLAGTWVPTDVSAMLDDNLSGQVSLSLTAGDDALTADLGTNVAGQSWVVDGPIDQPTLSFLRGSQFDRVVLPESDLDANPFPKTVVQPFEVAGTDETLIRAAVADAGLAAHFTNQPDPVLGAHQLLADLAQIYGDAPNAATNSRGVIVVTPAGWTPNAAFVNTFLDGLATSPILAPEQLDGFFAVVPPASDPRNGGPLIRQVVTDNGTIRGDAAALLAPDQVKARHQLDSLATTLPEDTAVYPHLERLLLEVPSTDLSVSQRQARLDDFAAGLRTEMALIQLPASRTITLTARKGQLPLNVTSLSDEPLRVLLQVQSDKLQFPGHPGTGPATFPLTLHKGNNLTVLTVEARTSGAFAMHIAVLSDDGNLVLTKTSFTVQSTALSGVGVVLSVGAALFLVVWWARHAYRARREAGRGDRTRRRHARQRGVQPGPGLAT